MSQNEQLFPRFLTADEAVRLASYQRPGVRLIVGPEKAIEMPIRPLPRIKQLLASGLRTGRPAPPLYDPRLPGIIAKLTDADATRQALREFSGWRGDGDSAPYPPLPLMLAKVTSEAAIREMLFRFLTPPSVAKLRAGADHVAG